MKSLFIEIFMCNNAKYYSTTVSNKYEVLVVLQKPVHLSDLVHSIYN